MTAGTKELIDGTFAAITDGNQLKQSYVFGIDLVLLQVAEYCFLRENIAGRGVNLFFATEQQKGCCN